MGADNLLRARSIHSVPCKIFQNFLKKPIDKKRIIGYTIIVPRKQNKRKEERKMKCKECADKEYCPLYDEDACKCWYEKMREEQQQKEEG